MSAQRFYTLGTGLKVNADSSGAFTGAADAVPFNVMANADLVFNAGFDACRL